MAEPILPVLLAGGSGTRLWPRSRELYPKQFLRLVGERTLLQDALARLDGLEGDAPILLCNEEHRFIVAEQCREAGVTPGAIILEPAGRNTAPAVTLAALHAQAAGADPVLLVLSADAFIGSPDGFRETVRRAAPFAADGRVVAIGVAPTHPETGYGYIRAGAALSPDGIAEVAAFTEKPDAATAAEYVAAGGYWWNAGIFLFRASVWLEELRAFRPDIHDAVRAAMEEARPDLDFLRPGAGFADCPADSIDYAVMEKTGRAVMAPAEFGEWTDLGSWHALAERLPADADGNIIEGDALTVDTRDSCLMSEERLIAAVGLDGVVVVDTADAILVAARARAQEVGRVVQELRERGRTEHREHTTSYRPWGRGETIQSRPGFLVKRLIVTPGESLSRQMHHHRAEHWVVVRGEALVERDDEEFRLATNESTYIPIGARHRLTNPGTELLEIIEVQVGDYLSEDDIVRFDDRYGRG